jgi:hypothetical protein
MVMKNGDCSFEGCRSRKKGTVLEFCCGIEDYGTVSRLPNEGRRGSNNEPTLHDMVAESKILSRILLTPKAFYYISLVASPDYISGAYGFDAVLNSPRSSNF